MPTLNWIGKDAVVKHHHEVPFHLLKDVPELSSGDPGAGNLVVRGDNLVGSRSDLRYLLCKRPKFIPPLCGWSGAWGG
jgi:site-specific DNA-methyltransferase (adenine-specific)/adenine-specific DNA-methyltransferase